MENKKIILVIRDGWGYRKEKGKSKFGRIVSQVFKKEIGKKFNAIKLANTKNTDYLEKVYPTIYLNASEKWVGLPEGFMGNSEVGHITMGAGRPVLQSLERINENIRVGDYLRNEKILGAIKSIKKNKSKFHLIILMQDAGVHSYLDHLFETLKYCKKEGLKQEDVILHLITDGRDDDPESGIAFLAEVVEKIQKIGIGLVKTISGRYYSMDRNNNLDRTEMAFNAIFNAKSRESKFSCGMDAIYSFYQRGVTDEFLPPLVKDGYGGVGKKDSIFFLNFRKDRARQLTKMIEKNIKKKELFFLTMTRYYDHFFGEVVFEDIIPENTLGDILEKKGKKQLRISETEKYAHVTFFFDGGADKNYKWKDEILIPSPSVKTYDLKAEMSSAELTKKIIQEVEKKYYDFILINYPNADMVGHTGNLEATIKAIEAVDQSVGRLTEIALKNNYTILLTADHGNAEEISKKFTSHTLNKVPFTFIEKGLENIKGFLRKGEFGLGNIAPTILELMKIKKGDEMNESLLKKK